MSEGGTLPVPRVPSDADFAAILAWPEFYSIHGVGRVYLEGVFGMCSALHCCCGYVVRSSHAPCKCSGRVSLSRSVRCERETWKLGARWDRSLLSVAVASKLWCIR